MYIGSYQIDDLLTFYVQTSGATGVAVDADSAPTYRVYEDETTAPILTGSTALIDASNTDGFYSEQITLSAANGFEYGKCYVVRISSPVSSVTGATWRQFQVGASTRVISGTGAGQLSVTSGVVQADAAMISASTTAADRLQGAYDQTAGAVEELGIVDRGTAQSVTGTTLVLRSAAAFADNELAGATLVIIGGTLGVGQSRSIISNVGSTDTVTVDTWTTTPTGTIKYVVFGSAPASVSSNPAVNVTKWNGTAVHTPDTAGYPVVTVKDGTGQGELNLASGVVDADIRKVDTVVIGGDGDGTPWGPA